LGKSTVGRCSRRAKKRSKFCWQHQAEIRG
jgi:hypothetical protein